MLHIVKIVHQIQGFTNRTIILIDDPVYKSLYIRALELQNINCEYTFLDVSKNNISLNTTPNLVIIICKRAYRVKPPFLQNTQYIFFKQFNVNTNNNVLDTPILKPGDLYMNTSLFLYNPNENIPILRCVPPDHIYKTHKMYFNKYHVFEDQHMFLLKSLLKLCKYHDTNHETYLLKKDIQYHHSNLQQNKIPQLCTINSTTVTKFQSKHDTCTICLGPFKQARQLECGHVFCKLCLYQYIKHFTSCPLCRNPIHKQYETFICSRPFFDQQFTNHIIQSTTKHKKCDILCKYLNILRDQLPVQEPIYIYTQDHNILTDIQKQCNDSCLYSFYKHQIYDSITRKHIIITELDEMFLTFLNNHIHGHLHIHGIVVYEHTVEELCLSSIYTRTILMGQFERKKKDHFI
jgi:hypothetical protein